VETKRERGTVLSWNDAEGHGRITSDAGDVLWAHFSFIREAQGFRTLVLGQRVEFSRQDAPGPPDERPYACDIVLAPQV